MKDKRRPSELEACWSEKDMAGGEVVPAQVLIMRTSGCAWAKAGSGGCTMCGYRAASISGVTEEDLYRQIDEALSKYAGEPFVKIYTSGSFLRVSHRDDICVCAYCTNSIGNAFALGCG